MKRILQKISTLLLLLLTLPISNVDSQEKRPVFAQSSVLKSGKWIKIRIDNSGIYRIKYSTLTQWGFANPSKVAIYGNGGSMLPVGNSEYRPDDLLPCASIHNNNSIIFYAKGANRIVYNTTSGTFTWETHLFDSYAYYFLTEQESATTPTETEYGNLAPSTTITNFDDVANYKKETYNLIRSGKRWFTDRFDTNTRQRTYNFNFPEIAIGENVDITIPLAARSSVATYFNITANGAKLNPAISIRSVNMYSSEGLFADDAVFRGSIPATQSGLAIQVEYTPQVSNSLGWIEEITVTAKSKIKLTSSQLNFRSKELISASGGANIAVENAGQSTVIWDVTEPSSPRQVKGTLQNGIFSFAAPSGTLREFVAFNTDGNFAEPVMVETVSNQDLHSIQPVNYVIVTHPDFLPEAQRLAEAHITRNEISVAVVTTTQIYNEFSSGSRDITAIRDFLRMLYNRADQQDGNRLKYLLLFGDGSYINKTDAPDNFNFIPTHQSANSIHQSESYVSDDYYGYLDDTDGYSDAANRLDIGIGRFPVQTLAQAAIAVNKSIAHMDNNQQGSWKRTLTFVADDGDSNIHISDSERIANSVSYFNPEFEVTKIFLDAYKANVTTSGKTYPDVNKAIDRAINQGTLIFNYTGHGGGSGLAHEGVVTMNSIQSWTNVAKQALFITATCEFARYDEKNTLSAGESVFLNPNGGGIALFTTTRIAYSHNNATINELIFDSAFGKDENNKRNTLGTIIKNTKNGTGTNIFKMSFTLLGDPALQLLYPELNVVTDSINGSPADNYNEPLKAMSTNTLSGSIRNSNGDIETTFSGNVTITIYDKKMTLTTLGNANSPYSYSNYQNIIFKGNAKVTNGLFSTKFIIPKDIRYNIAEGRISFYAWDDNSNKDAAGANNNILVGGISDVLSDDKDGPIIKMWLNNESFRNGQKTSTTPLFIAHLADVSGINTTGIGVGHDICLFVDGDRANPIILNEYFETDISDASKGTIYYQMPELAQGEHSLELRVWDNMNNSSLQTIFFEAVSGMGLNIISPQIYPNPATTATETVKLTFMHDDYDALLDIDIEIFGLNGEKMTSQKITSRSEGIFVPEIELNCRNLNSGIYIVRVTVKSNSGRSGTFSRKIMLMR
jgi:hypothetical protein